MDPDVPQHAPLTNLNARAEADAAALVLEEFEDAMERSSLQSNFLPDLSALSPTDAATVAIKAFAASPDPESQVVPAPLAPALAALATRSAGKYNGMLIELRKNAGRPDIALVLARFLWAQAPEREKALVAYGWTLVSVLQGTLRGKGVFAVTAKSPEHLSRVSRLAAETVALFLGEAASPAFGVVRETDVPAPASRQGAPSLADLASNEPSLVRFAASTLGTAQFPDAALTLLRALYDVGHRDSEWVTAYGWTIERAIRAHGKEPAQLVADADSTYVPALLEDVVRRLLPVSEGMHPLTVTDLVPPHSKDTLARLSKVIVGAPDQVRWTARLLRSAKRYGEGLELVRMLYRTDDTSDETAMEYGWSLMEAIRARDEEANRTKDTAASTALEEARRLTEEAAKLRLPLSEEGQKLGDYLRHYMVKHLDTEKHLADAYRELRARHTKSPDDLETLVQYGWTLHDCIDQSVNRLRDRRLVKLFRDELAALRFPETVPLTDTVTEQRARAFEKQFANLRTCQPRDLALADEFLKGLGEIRVVSREGNHAAAIAMAKRLLELNPTSLETKALLAREFAAVGDHQTAIQWWRECLEADPGSETHQKGLTWAIVDGIKAQADQPDPIRKPIIGTLISLTQTLPVAIRAAVASECHKIGALAWAFSLWARVLEEEPANVPYQTSLAWDIVRRLKELAAKDCGLPDRYEKIAKLVELFDRAPSIERPSVLYSMLLRRATDACNAGLVATGQSTQREIGMRYLNFVRAWGLRHLQDADFLPFEPAPGKSFPSLCEKVLSALYAATKVTEAADCAGWVADFMRPQMDRYPKQEWFPYYYGKLLVWAKRHADAREYLNQTARRKSSEFWVWSALADAYPDDRGQRVACLCRALQCAVKDEGYLVNLHEQLGDELRSTGQDSAARFEYDRSEAIRQSHNWRIRPRDPEFTAWHAATEPTTNNDLLYRELGARAETATLSALPRLPGNLEVRFHDPRKDRDVAVVGWLQSGAYKTTVVPLMRYPLLEDLARGAPLWVRVEHMQDREMICQLEPRAKGTPWDTYPMKGGVVVDVDLGMGISKAAIGYEQYCTIDHANHPEARSWRSGTLLQVGLPREQSVRGFPSVLVAIVAKELPPTDFIRHFDGDLTRNDRRGFGFVDDVFIPSGLVQTLPSDAVHVSGIALRGLDRPKNIPAWRALSVLPLTP